VAVRSVAAAALALALTAAAAAPAQIAWPWRPKIPAGAVVRFSGSVTDPAGAPMPGVGVAVEAWRSRFDLSDFERVKEDRTRVITLTDERGGFSIDWTWNPVHRQVAVAAYVSYRGPDGESELELTRVDVTTRLRDASPVTVALAVPRRGAEFVANLREFQASLTTEDERGTYHDLGLPERVDRIPTGAGIETAWWYFSRGQVCRFLDGERTEVEAFPPIPRSGGPRP